MESEDDGNIRFKDLSGDNLWINPAALRLARGKHGKKKAFAQQLFIKKHRPRQNGNDALNRI
ncbi:Integrase core domain-containing protein (fragment) [Exiguobacterium oxidotolerans]|uniref:Integrase core domain-containing protein n=1 Tax=Exiguobacterium oxidotolerans TaxID=223958 RepID=A0A653I2D7_9BACL